MKKLVPTRARLEQVVADGLANHAGHDADLLALCAHPVCVLLAELARLAKR